MSGEMQRSTPEQEGISSACILDLLNGFASAGAELHGIAIAVNGHLIFEHYQAPYAKDIPHVLHSLTKTFTNTAVGIAYSRGLIRLDEPVLKYFPQYAEHANEYLRALTLRNLITMRSGQVRSVQGNEWRPLKTSWIDSYFHIPFAKRPGSTFLYSSGNSYILSAIVQKVTGMTCRDLILDVLGKKLGLRDFSWQISPEGICSGGNGIDMCVDDILRFGMLYLQGGVWGGEQLLSHKWTELSLGLREPTPHLASEPEYNFHWRHTGDVWASRGKFGQACLLVPRLNMVVAVTMASEKHVAADLLQKYVITPSLQDQPMPSDGPKALASAVSSMTLKRPVKSITLRHGTPPQIWRWHCDEHPDGITDLTLVLENTHATLMLKDGRGVHSVVCGLDVWNDGVTSMTGHYLHHQYESDCLRVCASAHWEHEDRLVMEWIYPSMAFRDTVTLTLLSDKSVIMERSVNVNSEAKVRPPFCGTLIR